MAKAVVPGRHETGRIKPGTILNQIRPHPPIAGSRSVNPEGISPLGNCLIKNGRELIHLGIGREIGVEREMLTFELADPGGTDAGFIHPRDLGQQLGREQNHGPQADPAS